MMPSDLLHLPASGVTLVPFPFLFDYPIQQGFEFATDINTSDNETEQRSAVRDPARPRQRIRANVAGITRDEAMHMDALLYGQPYKVYGVPMWFDEMRLATATDVDDDELTVDNTEGRDLDDRILREEDVPVLLWRAHDDWEVVVLAATDTDTLTLREGVERVWPVGTRVVPLQLMTLDEWPAQTRNARRVLTTSLNFLQCGLLEQLNQPCDFDDDSDEPSNRVSLVRGHGNGSLFPGYAETNPANHANSPVPGMPVMSDPPADWLLFGFTVAVGISASLVETGLGTMYPSSKGRDTGFGKCTAKTPVDMEQVYVGKGIGSVVGVDASLSVIGPSPAPPGFGPMTAGGSFSGTGYAPPPTTPPASRIWSLAAVNMRAGIVRGTAESLGDKISSFGVYNPMTMAIDSTTVFEAMDANSVTLNFSHGFCVRCRNIQGYKGVKIVTEELLTEDPDTFASPSVTTHNFTMDDYDADTPGIGVYVKHLAGGSTLFGQAHGSMGPGMSQGYNGAFDDERHRVTVYLYKADDVDRLQWVDIFQTMLVTVEVVP